MNFTHFIKLILITNQTEENDTVQSGGCWLLKLPPMRKKENYSVARIVQPVVILVLFLIFLKLFAWDAWARFSRDDVQVQVKQEEDQTLNTPAVTICLDFVRITSWCFSPKTRSYIWSKQVLLSFEKGSLLGTLFKQNTDQDKGIIVIVV